MPTPIRPLADRFAEKWVEDAITGCWEWTGHRSASGYGDIRRQHPAQGLMRAHRAAYTLYVGPVPDGFDLDHLCRNRACVNPAHLEVVTRTENVRRGSATRLRPSQVAEIRRRYAAGDTRVALAAEFGISRSHLYAIALRQVWPEIEAAA